MFATRRFECLESRLAMDAGIGVFGPLPEASPGSPAAEIVPESALTHNAELPLDVNGDGQVSPIDALIVINRLNGLLPLPTEAPVHVDVNGDEFLSPIDALIVFNHLNNASQESAETAPVSDSEIVGLVGELDERLIENDIKTAVQVASFEAPALLGATSERRISAEEVDLFMSDLGDLLA